MFKVLFSTDQTSLSRSKIPKSPTLLPQKSPIILKLFIPLALLLLLLLLILLLLLLIVFRAGELCFECDAGSAAVDAMSSSTFFFTRYSLFQN
jgi:hypothetical protein